MAKKRSAIKKEGSHLADSENRKNEGTIKRCRDAVMVPPSPLIRPRNSIGAVLAPPSSSRRRGNKIYSTNGEKPVSTKTVMEKSHANKLRKERKRRHRRVDVIPPARLTSEDRHDEPPGTPSRIMGLPAEVRNAVYELCLTTPEMLTISRAQIFVTTPKSASYITKSSWKVESYEENLLSPNLLAVCKTINTEATPILYGANHFSISSEEKTHKRWTGTIGRSVEHLRTVTVIEAATGRLLKRVITGLIPAASLERMIVDGSCTRNFRSASKMAFALSSLVAHLHEARKGTAKKQALDVLEFGTGDAKILRKRSASILEADLSMGSTVKEVLKKWLEYSDQVAKRTGKRSGDGIRRWMKG